MQRLLARLDALRAAIAFPGRVRLVAQDRLSTSLEEVEWCGGTAAETIAAAAGIALAEHPRGGVVVALVAAEAEVGAALVTVQALQVPVLVAVAGSSSGDLAPYRVAGWAEVDAEAALPVAVPSVLLVTAPAGLRRAPPVREWAPVRLPSLSAWQRTAHASLDAALAALSAGEPRVHLVHADAPWSAAPASPATLLAAAALAGEGRRLIWSLPRGTDLLGWLPALRALGQRRLAVTLLIAAEDALPLAHWRALPGWWVASPGDDGEALAVLARTVASADAIAIVLPTASGPIPPWSPGDEHEPGGHRWFGEPAGARATVVCAGATLLAALAARDALAAMAITVSVLHCTSLHPLPEGALSEAAARGPLVVVDAGDGAVGLAAAVAHALPGVAWHAVSAWRGIPPGPADIAAALRLALGA